MVYALYILSFAVYRLHLKGVLLTQETNTSSKSDSLQIAQNPEIPYELTEEHTVDCPDCFDSMVKIYNSERISYYCENCDLIISEMGMHSFVG
jgi:formamidopyrimidine-DNA glycosylase